MVSHPDAPVSLWNGMYGNAVVKVGEPFAITGDGKRHEL
jgi:hypothetical protein